MKTIRYLAVAVLLCSSSLEAVGFGFDLGPFSLQLDLFNGEPYVVERYRDILDNPICFAISHQKRVEIIVERQDTISKNERVFFTEKLTIEPYAFGLDKGGKPVIRGNVVEKKVLKEVSVKTEEPMFQEDPEWADFRNKKEKSFFKGWFKSDNSQEIDVQRLSDIRIIQDSHFDIPKDFKGYQEENFRVICQLPANH